MNRIQEFLKRKGIEDKIVDYDESNEPFTPSYIIQEWEKEQLRIGDVSNRFDSKYTPPFRVGRKQGKAVLDATGREVIFFRDSEEQAKKYCNYLNGC